MVVVREYPGLEAEARQTIRRVGVNQRMPGFEMLIKALVIVRVEHRINLPELIKEVENNMSVVPSIAPVITDKSPVEQLMMEAIRSVGDDSENPLEFIKSILV